MQAVVLVGSYTKRSWINTGDGKALKLFLRTLLMGQSVDMLHVCMDGNHNHV